MAIENGGATAAPSVAPAAPQMSVLVQYIKDLSFENPNAPNSLTPREGGPQLNINVSVNAQPLTTTEFEVNLSLTARATHGTNIVFNVELVYSGIFRIQNVLEEHLHPFVMIECPRILFPFARKVIADATSNGGFPPLLIDPIDFVALYQQNIAQQAQVTGQPN
jgi:preprotein translocase subunit SecB